MWKIFCIKLINSSKRNCKFYNKKLYVYPLKIKRNEKLRGFNSSTIFPHLLLDVVI